MTRQDVLPIGAQHPEPVPTRALIVEDDPAIMDLIRSNLKIRGFDTIVSAHGWRALQLLEAEHPDVVLLDLMLPDGDGIEVCRQMRERSRAAIIVVSARCAESDKVDALHAGADDYMTKPFSIDEMLARILARLRRTRPTAAPVAPAPTVITIGHLRIDLENQQVLQAGQEVRLTPTEFSVLRELAIHRGKLLTSAHVLQSVWGPGYVTETDYVRVYVSRLRTKLEPPGSVPLIFTVPRVGYWMPANLAPGDSSHS